MVFDFDAGFGMLGVFGLWVGLCGWHISPLNCVIVFRLRLTVKVGCLVACFV